LVKAFLAFLAPQKSVDRIIYLPFCPVLENTGSRKALGEKGPVNPKIKTEHFNIKNGAVLA